MAQDFTGPFWQGPDLLDVSQRCCRLLLLVPRLLWMEFGCRSVYSWMTQRVLDYGCRLMRMPVGRLPAAVH